MAGNKTIRNPFKSLVKINSCKINTVLMGNILYYNVYISNQGFENRFGTCSGKNTWSGSKNAYITRILLGACL